MIVKTLDKYDFLNEYIKFFEIKEHNKIEYDKAKALYEYLEDMSEDIGEPIELDFIAFNQDYDLYHIDEIDELIDYYADYIDKMEELKEEIEENELEIDEVIDKIIDILEYYTSVRYISEHNTIILARF